MKWGWGFTVLASYGKSMFNFAEHTGLFCAGSDA